MKKLFTKLGVILTVSFFLMSSMSWAATITTTGSGNWSSTTADAPWPGGTVPSSTDNVIIAHAVVVDDGTAVCQDLSFTTGSISFGAASSVLSVYGNSTFGAGITNITAWTSGAKLVFAGTAAQTLTTGTTTRFDAIEINKASGTLTQQTGAIFRIGTSVTVTSGTFTVPAGNDIEGYQFADGTTASTPSFTVALGATLNIDNGATFIRSGSVNFTKVGSLTVYGTANLSTTSGNGLNFGNVTVGDGTNVATLNMTTNFGSSGLFNFNSLAVNNNSTFNMNATTMAASTITGDIAGTGTVVYGVGSSTGNPTLDRSFAGNLTMGAATRTWATTAPRTISGNLIINGSGTHTGTFGSGALTVNGDITITGTSRLTWSGNISTGGNVTLNSTNSTVALYPSSATATFSGASGKTFSVGAGTLVRIAATGTTPITTQHGGFSTFTCSATSTLEYYKTATASITVQDQYNGSAIPYGNLKVSHNNTTGSATLSVTINDPTINTSLALAQASALTAQTHTINVTFANTSTLTIPSLTASTVAAAGTLAENITLGAQPVIVTGNVSLTDASGTATATSCILTLNAGSLTINGTLTVGSTGVTTPFNTPYILLNDAASSLIVGGTTLRSLEQTNGNIKFTNNGQVVTFNGTCNTTLGNATSETFNFNGFNPTINFNGNFSDAATGTTFSVTGTEVPVINFKNGTLGTPMTTTGAKLRGAVTINGFRQASGAFRTENAAVSGYSMNIAGTLNLVGYTSVATNTGGGTNTLNGSGTIKFTGAYGTQITGYSTNNFQGTGTLHFAGSSAQTIPAGTYAGITAENVGGVILSGNTEVTGALTVTNGTLDCATSVVSGTGSFTLPAGATLKTANATGDVGSIIVSGTKTFDNAANYIFNGSGAQTIGTSVVTANNVEINNAVGVNIAGNMTVSALTVDASAILNVIAGKQLTVSTTLTNNGSLNLLSTAADGTATILTPPTITTGIAGTYTVQQYLTTGRNWYITSPVSGATSNVFNAAAASNINKLYWYDEPNGSSATLNWPQITDNTTSLNVAKGYVANVDGSLLSTTNGVTFTGGSLNTGDITTGVNGVPVLTSTPASGQYQGYNLIGNPYPSYLNIDNLASNTDIVPTYWYRSNNSGYVFDTYNIPSAISTGLSGLKVSANIPPMQAFWLRVASGITSPSVSLLNANRRHQDDIDNKFRAPASLSRQILRLLVSNGLHIDEAVIYTDNNAAKGYDKYDSPKMSNYNVAVPEIYTTAGTEKLVINGLNDIPANTELPLGFITGQSNAFSIKATEFSNFDSNTKVYLKDKLSDTEQDLTDGTAYTFASDIASTTDRFSLIFKVVGITTDVNTAAGNQATLIYKNTNNQIAVNCNEMISPNAVISVYNSVGQKLESKQITGATTVINKTFNTGVYIVTVINAGKSTTGKVILN